MSSTQFTQLKQVAVPVRYRCPYCKENVDTFVVRAGFGMTYGRTGFGHSLSRSEEIKLSEEAEKSAVNIVRDFYAMKPEEMMRFLDSSCPKCKERNKWIPIPRKTSIGFVMFALDILLFLVFIYVTLMWRWNAALCLAFIILLEDHKLHQGRKGKKGDNRKHLCRMRSAYYHGA